MVTKQRIIVIADFNAHMSDQFAQSGNAAQNTYIRVIGSWKLIH